MYLEIFMTTMIEYKRFIKELPMKVGKSLLDSYDESTYVAVQVRLMLLRKYTSKGKKNNVYIENLITEAKTRFPDGVERFNDIQTRFQQIYKQSIQQILSDGTKLNLYESIEDIMYGLYLHADEEKIFRLSRTNEQMRFLCTKKYVEDVEAIVLELYEYFTEINISNIVEKVAQKAPVIHLGESDLFPQQIELSPYWENMYGVDVSENEEDLICKDISEEEILILSKAILFLEELKKENISIEVMRSIVFNQTIDDWGDFEEAINFFGKINNPGISNRVRFNEHNNAAYVRIWPQVNNTFAVFSPHIISDVYEITFIRDIATKDWRIFAFGGHVEPYL